MGGDDRDLGYQCPVCGGMPLTPILTIKSLGMILDSFQLIEAQIANVARLAFLQLC